MPPATAGVMDAMHSGDDLGGGDRRGNAYDNGLRGSADRAGIGWSERRRDAEREWPDYRRWPRDGERGDGSGFQCANVGRRPGADDIGARGEAGMT